MEWLARVLLPSILAQSWSSQGQAYKAQKWNGGLHSFASDSLRQLCAVTTTNAEAARRSVSVIFAEAAAALAAVTPGTISNSTPARRSASSSSPSRPKTAGSPDFSLTMVCASVSRACQTMSALICSWLRPWCPHRLPTLITCARPGKDQVFPWAPDRRAVPLARRAAM